MLIEKINLDKRNRILRIGFGKHKDSWFFRIDLWCVGYRFKRGTLHYEISIDIYDLEKKKWVPSIKYYTKSKPIHKIKKVDAIGKHRFTGKTKRLNA